jgi:DNA-binding phage protein
MSVEVKSKRGKLAAHQEQWRAAVAKAGGIAIVARSAEPAREGVDRWTPSE